MVYNRMNDHNYNRVLVATGVEQQTLPAIKMTHTTHYTDYHNRSTNVYVCIYIYRYIDRWKHKHWVHTYDIGPKTAPSARCDAGAGWSG